MLAVRGTTLGWSPPSTITECERDDGRRCSRLKFHPMSMSSTASRALRPRHGAPAACAVSPSNEKIADTRPVPPASPQLVEKPRPTCTKITASASRNSPCLTKYALVPTSSSATPGQITSVPGIFSRCMRSFAASAAVTITAIPELCPSP